MPWRKFEAEFSRTYFSWYVTSSREVRSQLPNTSIFEVLTRYIEAHLLDEENGNGYAKIRESSLGMS